MTATEPDRQDLYTGLVDVLGETRARTLMTLLPSQDPSSLALKSDLAALENRLDRRLDTLEGGLAAVNARLDRLFVTLVAGLFVIVAAMAGVTVSSLT